VRPIPLDGSFTFLASPCEYAPVTDVGRVSADEAAAAAQAVTGATPAPAAATGGGTVSTLELIRRPGAERVELPLEAVRADSHPLDDLHLSSITVGQIVNQVTRELGRPAVASATNYATSTLGDLARTLDELADTALPTDSDAGDGTVAGVEPWVRAFGLHHVESAPPVAGRRGSSGSWAVDAPPGHPRAAPLRPAP